MCLVSNVGDMYTQRIPHLYPWVPTTTTDSTGSILPPSQAEFDELKKMVEEMHDELRRAKAQDIADGNADCEMEDKVELLKRVAEMVGVDLEDVFG